MYWQPGIVCSAPHTPELLTSLKKRHIQRLGWAMSAGIRQRCGCLGWDQVQPETHADMVLVTFESLYGLFTALHDPVLPRSVCVQPICCWFLLPALVTPNHCGAPRRRPRSMPKCPCPSVEIWVPCALLQAKTSPCDDQGTQYRPILPPNPIAPCNSHCTTRTAMPSAGSDQRPICAGSTTIQPRHHSECSCGVTASAAAASQRVQPRRHSECSCVS